MPQGMCRICRDLVIAGVEWASLDWALARGATGERARSVGLGGELVISGQVI